MELPRGAGSLTTELHRQVTKLRGGSAAVQCFRPVGVAGPGAMCLPLLLLAVLTAGAGAGSGAGAGAGEELRTGAGAGGSVDFLASPECPGQCGLDDDGNCFGLVRRHLVYLFSKTAQNQ